MKKIIAFFVNNPLLVKVFLVVSFLGGLMAFNSLERESFPKVDFNIVLIQTLYPGASPLDVELNVSKKIEEEIDGIDGLDKYISTSSESISMVTVWIDIDEKDPDRVKRDIQKAVDKARASFPAKAEIPVVTEIKTQNIPIVRLVVSSEEVKEAELRKITRNLEDAIKDKVPEVSKLNRVAYRDAQVKVLGDLVKMKTNHVSLQDISNSIKNYNIRLGGGSIESYTQDTNIVTISEFKSLEEVENVIIRSNFQTMSVKIKDVAEVQNDFSDRDIYARGSGHNGIILEVIKKEGLDVIRTVDKIYKVVADFQNDLDLNQNKLSLMEALDQLKKSSPAIQYKSSEDFTKIFFSNQYLGFSLDILKQGTENILKNPAFGNKKVKIVSTADITKNTRKLLKTTATHGIEGFIMVFLFLVLFLEIKSAVWTSFGIPYSLMIAFLGMSYFGFTINNIALFGIIIILGSLVDNQIVVAENIFQKREKGMSGPQAAIEGAAEMFAPVISATLVTIVAFLPLAFFGGIMGKFVYQLPIVIILALLGSTLEAFLSLPSHLRIESKSHKKSMEGKKWFKTFLNSYKKFLHRVLRIKYIVAGVFIFLLIFSIFLMKKMDFVFMSNKDNEVIMLSFEGPEGISLDEMFKRVKHIEEMIIKEVPYKKELDSICSMVGTTRFSLTEGGQIGKNLAVMRVFLVPYDNRNRTAADVVTKLRDLTANQKDFKKLIIREQQGGAPIGQPVEIKVISNDDVLRKHFADQIEDFLKKQPGVFALDNDDVEGNQEIRIKFDQNAMYSLGVNPLVLASTLRIAYKGDAVSSIITQDEDIDIVVQLRKEYRQSVEQLKDILIPSNLPGSSNKTVRLGSIASFRLEKSLTSILRFDGKRATTLTSELNYKKNTVPKVINAVMEKFGPEIKKHPDLRLRVGGEGEQTEESLKKGAQAFLIAVLGIFLILLLEFKSFTQPIFVLFTLPFGFIGVVLAFIAHGEPWGFMAIIGLVGLAGVVVNHSIVMVDLINRMKKTQSVKTKDDMIHLVVEGASGRLRPILLTSITAVIGLFPSIYGWGGSVFIIRPIGIAIGYGLIFSTLLTLLLIPCFYMIDFDIRMEFGRIVARFKKMLAFFKTAFRKKSV